jgi:hypothetical protein
LDKGTNCFLIIYTPLPPIKYLEILSLEDIFDAPLLVKIEELTGIYRSDPFRMLKDAHEKVDYIFSL